VKIAKMINVVAKKCIKCELKVPNFNVPGQKKGYIVKMMI
jgi:hypothetical protein